MTDIFSDLQAEAARQQKAVSKQKEPNRPKGKTVRKTERTDVTTVRTYDSTDLAKRITKRHPFEIYIDQLESLQKLKAQATLDNKKKNMSEMVREAIDEYLKKGKGSSVRTDGRTYDRTQKRPA